MDNLNRIKRMYCPGMLIELIWMDDPQAPPTGTLGRVLFVDDIGQIHMQWENGSSLALNVDCDEFNIL